VGGDPNIKRVHMHRYGSIYYTIYRIYIYFTLRIAGGARVEPRGPSIRTDSKARSSDHADGVASAPGAYDCTRIYIYLYLCICIYILIDACAYIMYTPPYARPIEGIFGVGGWVGRPR